MRRAWEAFFTAGTVLPFVRPAIAESWLRSRQLGISPHLRTRHVERGLERLLSSQLRQLLVRASEPVITRLAEATDGSPLSFTLTDADGLILVQRGSALLLAHSERIGVVPGSRWAELDIGTNGIGTSLARRQPMQVVSAEHYCETFHDTVCTATLVRHPLTRQAIGVFDITSSYAQPTGHVWALASQAAALIEREIQDLLVSGDEYLLQTLSSGRTDVAAYAVDLEGRHTIANRGATALLTPEDYASLWTYAQRCIREPTETAVPHVLKSGQEMLVQINPVLLGDEPVGALVVLRHRRRSHASTPRVAAGRADDWSPFRVPAQWLVRAQACAGSPEPVLIVGEPGAGKSALAAALLRNGGTPGVRVVDCASLDSWGAIETALAEPGDQSVLFEGVLDLPVAQQPHLISWLERNAAGARRRIVATAAVADEAALRAGVLRQDLVDRLAVEVIRVPPLRERRDDIAALAVDLVHELAPERELPPQPITQEALEILQAYAWPGNVRQLHNVLHRTLLLRPHGQIDVGALPPDLVLTSAGPRRGLMEQVEGETILRTLQATGGNVAKAAEVMGLSRATVYRRLHAYRALRRPTPPGPRGSENGQRVDG
jgi:transcriptional regulator of acetoin/glycerol metabolism